MHLLGVLTLSLGIGACGGGSGGGSGSGGGAGGVTIIGTVPDNRELASRELEIRATSGERAVATIEADGRFTADALPGTGPYLLRAAFGDDEAWYSLVHVDAAGPTTANVHAYTDLAIRNQIAARGGSLDTIFDAEGPSANSMLPNIAQANAVKEALSGILAPSLAAYGLDGIDLSNVSFAADGQGVDEFLTENPAIVQDDAFTILATDPDTDTRTTVSEAVPLSRDLLAEDTVPPTAPGSLRALPATSDEIVLVWEPAVDDLAVTLYEVRRDGESVATTPFPVYSDAPLAGGVDYAYTVIAIDEAGNRSPETSTGAARPLDAPDTTPPPAPGDVTLTARTASVRLSWTQDGIADVAAFRVQRSIGGGMLALVTSATATALTDVDLRAATEYCYAVIAVDASENASAPSPSVCTTTAGTGTITTPRPPVTPTAPTAPPTTPTTNAASALLAVDVTDIACDIEVEEASVDDALVLDAPCYRLPGGLSVRDGGQVTVAAGTVLKFGSNRGVNVASGGSFQARGTPDAPIVLSGIDPTPGFWSGVEYRFSNSTRNVLENVVIEYAGSASAAALETTAQSSQLTRLAVRSVLLRRNGGDGFGIDRATLLDAFDDVISTANGRSGTIHAEVAPALSDVRLTGNTVDGLFMTGSSANRIDEPTVWPSIDVPWFVNGLAVNAPFEIPAGAELRFSSNDGIDVGSDGSLRAVGSADAPILLTGTDATAGFWNGVQFRFSNSANNRLEHVTIEYAGTASNTGGALVSIAQSNLETRLALVDVTLRFSQGPGFRFQNFTRPDAFERVVSTSNAFPGQVGITAIGSLGEGLAFIGNESDRVSLLNSTITSPVTIPAIGVAYAFDDINVNDALTIEPGVTLIADAGGSLDVSSQGSLSAVGTASAPITIVGSSAQPGHWSGIDFRFSNSARNRFEHVEIRHGGGTSVSSGNITMQCQNNLPGQLSISNSTVADSAGWGIFRSPTFCTTTLGAAVVFAGNAQGGINPIDP